MGSTPHVPSRQYVALAAKIKQAFASIDAVIDGTEETWVSEYRFLHNDGHALSIIDRGSVIRDESGRAVGMVGGMLDVSPQRELEGRLR